MKRFSLVAYCVVCGAAILVIAARKAESGQAVGVVRLQAAIPGIQQIGNTNVSGMMLAGQMSATTASSKAVQGNATAVSGSTYGGWFQTASTDGKGVQGYASSGTGITYGVLGSCNSTAGRAVQGNADALSGDAYGGWFQCNSNAGHGVYGFETAASGITYGVRGQSNSTGGRGVQGNATATSGSTFGGFFQCASTTGIGAYGQVTASTGITYGILGNALSTQGRAIQGNASASTGDTYGGWFQSDSTSGKGVQGYASATSGINYGVLGSTNSIQGRGVQGNADALTGDTYGGFFRSDSTDGKGVQGYAAAPTGITYGVLGSCNSVSGRAVQGNATSATGPAYGGWFQSDSANGVGVLARATAVGGLSADFFGTFHVTGNQYIYDTSGNQLVGLGNTSLLGTVNGQGSPSPGLVYTYALGSSSNVITALSCVVAGGVNTNRGYVTVAHNGVLGAGMYMNSDLVTGSIFASIKNFREPNPYQEGTDITYACVEGPEAAMYIRGTTHLVSGRATIILPRHFTVLAILKGMTVQLTPLSPDSEGLCVTRKGLEDGIEVAELRHGTGSYDFDYEVKAIRARYKDYKVIQPSMRMMKSGGAGNVIDEREVRQLDSQPVIHP